MKHEHDKDLVARLADAHPSIFKNRVPASSNLPQGWYELVHQLCSNIETELGTENLLLVSVLQIKEKFGTLRFYAMLDGYERIHVDVLTDTLLDASVVGAEPGVDAASSTDGASARLWALIDTACSSSASICQKCGAPGKLRPLGWVQTLCDAHFADRKT